MNTVLVIGAGDMGERIADGLAASENVQRVLLASRSHMVDIVAATISSARDCVIEPVTLDATDQSAVATLLTQRQPDLVVQCASLRSPWDLSGREDDAARAVLAAGLALRLPYQLPAVLAVMRAVRETGFSNPVANLSFPDVTGPILDRLGLAPTVGLGNAAMMLLRVRAVLRRTQPTGPLPLIRVIGHHGQLFDVMRSRQTADTCQVYLGEDGQREDSLAYQAPAIPPGPRYNVITAAAVMPVVAALLPGAEPLRTSTASPAGLPGGYPVHITEGIVTLDLPPEVSKADAIAFNERAARGDGIERIDDDGTVHVTEASQRAVSGIAPELAGPISIEELPRRAALIDKTLH